MIKPLYGVKCLRLGFERFKRYCKLPIDIKVSKTSASFYVKKPTTGMGKNARVSGHHPNLQNYANPKNEAWLTDNVSIEFIVPKSKEDMKKLSARVFQNAEGTIKPFDVPIYQYDSTIIEPYDLVHIFDAIIAFLNGKGYVDPFIGTKKQAKVIPRHSNIKPYRGKKVEETISRYKIHEITIYCIGDFINENKPLNRNRNMKRTIRLTESELRGMIQKAVKGALNEDVTTDETIYFLDEKESNILGMKLYGMMATINGFRHSLYENYKDGHAYPKEIEIIREQLHQANLSMKSLWDKL